MGRRKALVEGPPENRAKAKDFLEWFAVERERVEFYIRGCLDYDEDLVSDALIRTHDAIVRRGTDVDDYLGYFLYVYKNTFLDAAKAKTRYTVQAENVRGLAAPDYDSAAYEDAVEAINAEVMDYVRESYDEVAVSLFEIYVGLLPDISYKRLSRILGIPATKIWPVIGRIKKDVAERFGGRRSFLLSGIVNF